ncbi:MAG: hypothetical protein B7Y70_09695 [Rhizobiales bacterium 35-68-8]|nr:MAG: hypothetical protein B7Y70_09695 [Rhizobiales bacterium 35-68-8]
MRHPSAGRNGIRRQRNGRATAPHHRGHVGDAAFGLESSVTISLGVAQHIPGEDVDDWMKRADDALNAAKDEGHNRVVLASQLAD